MFHGHPGFTLGDYYIAELHWNDARGAFGFIHHIQNREPLVFQDVGLFVTYPDKGQFELTHPHWHAECYLANEHFHDELIDLLGQELMKNTSCKEPFLLNVCRGERANGIFREYGQVKDL